MTCAESTAHWGVKRLEAHQAQARIYGRGHWGTRKTHRADHPCWELVPNGYWTQDWAEMRRLWREAGGRCFEEGRIIAGKWDAVWQRFADGFPAGYGDPFPPFGREDCSRWEHIDEDEAIVLGVITEEELREWRGPATPGEKEIAEIFASMTEEDQAALLAELDMDDSIEGRARRVAARRRAAEEARIERERRYEEERPERERALTETMAIAETFETMHRMDGLFAPRQPVPADEDGALMAELREVMEFAAFDRHPRWKAKAIRYAGMLLEARGEDRAALEYYEAALAWDGRQPVKRRIAALRIQLG